MINWIQFCSLNSTYFVKSDKILYDLKSLCMKRLERVPFRKNEAQELELLMSQDTDAQRQYVLWYGFQSLRGQMSLAQGNNRKLILLQDYIYPQWWHNEARDVLRQRGFLPPPDPDDEQKQWEAYCNWLSYCRFGDRNQEPGYGQIQMVLLAHDVRLMPIIGEDEQMQWFIEKNEEKIRTYGGRWKGKAAVRFFLEGAEEVVYRYLQYRLIKNKEEQCALIQRDINHDNNGLIWFYFNSYRAFPEAQKMIQAYDQNLWRRVIQVNYGWDFHYEQKFGCLKNWQEKLDANFPLLAHCPVEQIRDALDSIK